MTSLDIQLTGKILENEKVCKVRAQKPRRRPPSWNFWREMRFGSLDPSFRFSERSQSETSALILKETPRKQGVRVVKACLKKMSVKQIYYSEKYYDDVFEYR